MKSVQLPGSSMVIISSEDELPPLSSRAQLIAQRAQMFASTSAASSAACPSQTSKRTHDPDSQPMDSRQSAPKRYRPTKSSWADRRFWEGIVLTTANEHRTRSHRDVTFQELLGPVDDMSSAIATTYADNDAWVDAQFPTHVNLHYVKPDKQNPAGGIEIFRRNMTLYYCVIPQGGKCMHIKLFIFFYSNFARVVISSGNLYAHDWGPTENVLYVHDLPKLATVVEAISQSPFCATLMEVLRSLSPLPFSVYASLPTTCDWTKTSNVRLVHNIYGKYPESTGMGMYGLREALNALDLQAKPEQIVRLECQGSSLGSYKNVDWLRDFYTSASARARSYTPREVQRYIQILFPSLDTVKESMLGPAGAHSFFCHFDQWNDSRFMFRSVKSKQSGVLMHAKLVLALYSDATTEAIENGYVYLGSHNFTSAAWGKPTKNHIHFSNSELGVVIPLKSPLFDIPGAEEGENRDLKRRADCAVLWQRPTARYDGDEEPWMLNSSQAIRLIERQQADAEVGIRRRVPRESQSPEP